MADLSTSRVALYGLVFGSTVALGCMFAYAVRSVSVITRDHRWYQLKHL